MAERGTTLNGRQHPAPDPGTQGQHHRVAPHRTAAGRLPSVLSATRHLESTAKVEFQLAEASGAVSVPMSCRDADIPLSLRGRQQAQALGRWWAGLPAADRP
ncbi:hypothetical protein VM98_37955, partial [Streptomyces rubellomurinus subsp. indigoferus]